MPLRAAGPVTDVCPNTSWGEARRDGGRVPVGGDHRVQGDWDRRRIVCQSLRGVPPPARSAPGPEIQQSLSLSGPANIARGQKAWRAPRDQLTNHQA
jgi:hypothetical protein